MEKILIVSQTCPKCFSLLKNLYDSELYKKLFDKTINIVYYNEHLQDGEHMMSAPIKYMENLDREKYEGIPFVTPVLIEYKGTDTEANVLAIGESSIFTYIKDL